MAAMDASQSDNGAPAGLTVLVDGEPQLTYDRSLPLAEAQRGYLERLDVRMDGGVQLGGERIEAPDTLQRAQFIALQLVDGLQQDDDARVAAACAWLATRLPDLTQVRARLVNGGFSVELVFNEPFVKEVTVGFAPRPQS